MHKIGFLLTCLTCVRCALRGRSDPCANSPQSLKVADLVSCIRSFTAVSASDSQKRATSIAETPRALAALLRELSPSAAFNHAGLNLHVPQVHATANRAPTGLQMTKLEPRSKKPKSAKERNPWNQTRTVQRQFWREMKRRVKHAEQMQMKQNDGLNPILKGIREDINATIALWAMKIDLNLGISLQKFQQEVLNEWSPQDQERDPRLKARQDAIMDSITALGQDLRDEIELGLEEVKRNSEDMTWDLKDISLTWELEVNDLINATKADVQLAFEDLEDAINLQRDEWWQNVKSFENRWLEPFDPRNASRAADQPDFPLQLLNKEQIDLKRFELQATIDSLSEELESDLKLFKKRWKTTTDRLQEVPADMKDLENLADIRMYVANTIFAGDVPALLTERKQQYQRLLKDGVGPVPNLRSKGGVRPPQALTNDPLGLRKAASQETNPLLIPTEASNLRLPDRQITVITTASLPWMTGTSINPLLRAAYLAKAGYSITLMLPWLEREDQLKVFPNGLTFKRPQLQEQYIRWWCAERASVGTDFMRIRWYPASYVPYHDSVFQNVDDISSLVPPSERDVVILEEPEHLNWYHHGPRWTDTFNHVIGIGHTNYLKYARDNSKGIVKSGAVKEKYVGVMNNIVCAAYTDVCVKLSATLPNVSAPSLVCNVHGVRAEFLAIGQALKPEDRDLGIYFLGKALYTKGYRELIDAFHLYKEENSDSPDRLDIPHVDTYGSGPEFNSIVSEIKERALPIQSNAGIDHAHPTIHRYKVFVNPSTSDVLCTATAEALAMGKIVIIPDHPSNTFFKQFSNTMMYQHTRELVPLLHKALAREPGPMPSMEAYMLSWEAASERLLDAAAVPEGTRRKSKGPTGTAAYALHYAMSTQPFFDVIRTVTGRGPVVPWKERFSRKRSKTSRHKGEDGDKHRDGSGRFRKVGGRLAGKFDRLGGRVRDFRTSLANRK